jgi:hypothetical protein
MTTNTFPRRWLATAAAALAVQGLANAQIFSDNQADIPQGNPDNNSLSENVDFGDVDLDGDFDAIFADGGDDGNDQNRIWINMAGLQAGTIGIFQDQTATRFPVFLDDSRDIEFGDFDQDGDLDIYSSNTAQLTNQGNRWWINNGGIQGGTLGFYVDQTSTRWAGLGAAGSSIPPGALIGGTFIDWSCDCDFGDLDNDGDLDLVHSSYGGAFGGEVPTRLFLNDGAGVFVEFNPSGFQLPGNNINNGNPALWAQGTQSANTTNATGVNADVASSALDIDVGDIDGDYDLDILHGAREQLPRMFQNRLAENGGSTLAFRDVTGSAFPAGYSTGNGHYEQEMGDLDADGDIDIYGLNWLAGFFNFNDATYRNNGSGVYTTIQTLSNSSSDDNEGDFLDYDADGDLDLFVANFSGSSKLYRGDNTGFLTYQTGSTSGLNVTGFVALDADACDVDEDGDFDVFQSNDNGARNQFWENNTTGNDVLAPTIPRHENPGTQSAADGDIVVRAHVYDNAPYYSTWYAQTAVRVEVDGFRLPNFVAHSSAGQVFRAVLPKHLVGSVGLQWQATDVAGNTGTSSTNVYASNFGGTFEVLYGSGSADANAIEPTVELLSLTIPGRKLWFGIEGSPNATYILAYAAASFPTFLLPGIGNINIDPLTANASLTGLLDANGKAVHTANVPGFLLPGQSVFFQVITLAPQLPNPPSPGTSQGLELIVQ